MRKLFARRCDNYTPDKKFGINEHALQGSHEKIFTRLDRDFGINKTGRRTGFYGEATREFFARLDDNHMPDEKFSIDGTGRRTRFNGKI
ncbi:MAG: hypothetical protein IJU48_01925 [Synergistaceae bacterium]|nr:hypothetical protein [Synergistaceae bacterium]